MPERFRWPQAACPHRTIREHADVVAPVARLVRDHRSGVLSGWPDAYTAAASETVYLALEHSDSAVEAVEARDAARR